MLFLSHTKASSHAREIQKFSIAHEPVFLRRFLRTHCTYVAVISAAADFPVFHARMNAGWWYGTVCTSQNNQRPWQWKPECMLNLYKNRICSTHLLAPLPWKTDSLISLSLSVVVCVRACVYCIGVLYVCVCVTTYEDGVVMMMTMMRCWGTEVAGNTTSFSLVWHSGWRKTLQIVS